MKVYQELSTLPLFNKAVVTIGTFDGVHLGHKQVIKQLKQTAEDLGGETVIITFHPHPRKVISSVPGDIKLLNTLNEKIALLDAAGIHHLVVVPFNHAFANQTAAEYIKDFLWKNFKPHTIIIGYDHRFGKGREGDYHLMDQYGSSLGFNVKEIPEQILNEIIVSSTRIRESLLNSNVDIANKFLGYNYFFEGTVIEGNKLGRTIGYPTANLQIESEEKLIPGNGVYAVEVQVGSHESGVGSQESGVRRLEGMMNIGVRPTVDGKKRMIEVNIFDFDEDIYTQTLRVRVKHYIRGEVKFNSLGELKEQLLKDKISAKEVLKS